MEIELADHHNLQFMNFPESEEGRTKPVTCHIVMSDSDSITLSVTNDMPQHERTYKRHIYTAVASGNWVEASSYDKIHPNWVRVPLTASGNTALHVAVSMKQTSFVAKLVERISMQDMEIRKADGNTAFCIAAISGNVEIATILLIKNSRLVWIKGPKETLPIQLASSAGHPHMVEFLYEKTREDLHINLPFHDIVKLFFLTITNNIYTVAWNLLDRFPKLANAQNKDELTALQVLAQSSFHEDVPVYRGILRLLFKAMEEEESLSFVRLSKAMFDAAKLGNIVILEFLIKYDPDLLIEVNYMGQSILHLAILYRQENVHRLILSKGASNDVMMQLVDCDGNNILHLAGKLAPEGRFGSPTPQVLMCSEEIWFQEVEKRVPPALKTMRNNEGLTPKELFYKEHKELCKEAVSDLRETANTFLVVATLIVTLGITAAVTIPVKDVDGGETPIFRKKIWYMIFLLSTVFGTCFCASSMIFYTSVILPSYWTPRHEYVHPKQIRFTFGNTAITASLGIMLCVSYTSGYILIYDVFPHWVFCFIAALTWIPFLLSLVLNYNLWTQRVHLLLVFCKEMLSRAFPISRFQRPTANKIT